MKFCNKNHLKTLARSQNVVVHPFPKTEKAKMFNFQLKESREQNFT